jgi:hypothetical protein
MHPVFAVASAAMLRGSEQRPIEALVEAPLVWPSVRPATQGAGVGCIDAFL